jgi:hypothetical protein
MAKLQKDRRAGQSGPAANGIEVVNLAAMRAQRSQQPRYVVDQNGKRHALSGLTLDSYLAMLEIDQMYRTMADDPDNEQQAAMMQSMRDAILAALPDFPVGGLYFEELPVVLRAVQEAVMPGSMAENASDAEPGKST